MPRMAESARGPIDGWNVRQEGGCWTAIRKGGLSATQAEYGCKLAVTAASLAALQFETTAEDVKAGMIAAAELLAQRLSDRSDEVRS